jgi:hypothetical protein
MPSVRTNISSSIIRTVKNALKNATMMNDIGKYVVKNIKANTRMGKNINGRAFPGLEESTVNYRYWWSKWNIPSEFAKPEKDNLHLSGQMIESINYTANESKMTVSVEPTGDRIPYYNSEGKAMKVSPKYPTNYKLAELHQKTRPFMGLTDNMKKWIVNRVKSALRLGLNK